jgi:hypothetical protein
MKKRILPNWSVPRSQLVVRSVTLVLKRVNAIRKAPSEAERHPFFISKRGAWIQVWLKTCGLMRCWYDVPLLYCGLVKILSPRKANRSVLFATLCAILLVVGKSGGQASLNGTID